MVGAAAVGSASYGRKLLWRAGLVDPWKEGFRLKAAATLVGWEGYLAPVGAFPLPERRRPELANFLERLVDAAAQEFGASSEVFIQGHRLQQRDNAAVLASHGREWVPRTGLGVWPDREPPRLPNWKDLVFKLPGMPAKTLMYNVFQITAGEQARRDARRTMAGRGTLVEILHGGSTEAVLGKMQEVLLPPIREPTFRSFPYYVPLLERRNLGGDLDRWLGAVDLYLRESPEDDSVVIVSHRPLRPVLEKLGAQRDSGGWRAPR